MKKCLVCQQTYTDESLNFCLNDGGVLQEVKNDPPPTVFMNQARVTNPTNWTNTTAPPATAWQNSPAVQNSQHLTALRVSKNQTLPTISLVLGILSVVTFCFCGGIPFGIGALITGYLGLNNANSNPQIYDGRGLAIAGMVTGGIGFVGALLMFLISLLGKH